MATPKTIAFHTLGCKLNYAETSTLSQQFRDRGYQVVRDNEPADIFVLNTCSVTDFADRKCRKAIRQALRCNPQARVVVTGCYAQLRPEEIAEIPGVDLVLGAGQKFQIVSHVEALDDATDRSWVFFGAIEEVSQFYHAQSYGDRTRSFLKVQDGCDYKCAFCTIPQARGKSRSPRIAEVVDQAQQLEARGVKEVVLTGVNIGDFGASQEDTTETFLELIQALDVDTGIPRFRISSIEPNLCHDQIIDFVAASQRFMPHFHMPLQSGCDRTLRRMRRRYSRQLYADRMAKIKEVIPDACIGADIIVGFPGETRNDFTECQSFVETLDISYLHVFSYSERPGTPAAAMSNPVPHEVRKQRGKTLQTLSTEKMLRFYRRHLQEERPVLLERSKCENELTGFTDNYIKISVSDGSHHVNDLVTLSLQKIRNRDGVMICA